MSTLFPETLTNGNIAAYAAGMTIGERLREARESRGWGVREVGRRSGLSASAISRYESGERIPRAATLARLTRALGVTVGEILGEPAPPKPEPAEEMDEVRRRLARLERRERRQPRRLRHDAVRIDGMAVGDADPEEAAPMVEGEHDADIYCLLVRGDCLAPDIEPGNVLIMSRVRRPQIGDVVSVLVHGERQLKLVIQGVAGLRLTSRRGDLLLPDEGAHLEGVMIGEPLAERARDRRDIGTRLAMRWFMPADGDPSPTDDGP